MENKGASAADLLYGRPGGSEVVNPSVAHSTLGGAFEHAETELRGEGDAEAVKMLADTRNQLAGALSDLGVSPGAAKEFTSLLAFHGEKLKNYTAPDAAGAAKAMDRLLDSLGPQAEQVYSDSKSILAVLVSRAPALAGLLDSSGIRFDPEFHRLLGSIGAHRRRQTKR